MIKLGSVIREHKYGAYIESTVITEPITTEEGKLEFKSKTESGHVIDYLKNEDSLELVKQ